MTDLTEYAVAKAIGARRERERIIALLEAELGNLYGPDRERLIALIKGENE